MGLKSRAEGARKKKKKKDKYQDLRIELRRLWDKSVEIVPIIIVALGTIYQSPYKENLEELGADVAPGLLQKTVLETAHIIRRVMDS